MYASKHPFRDTLVIEIDRDDVLSLHGQLIQLITEPIAIEIDRDDVLGLHGQLLKLLKLISEPSQLDSLLSILEAFHAGTDMTRFDRPSDDPIYVDDAHHYYYDSDYSDPAIDQLRLNETRRQIEYKLPQE